MIDEIEEEENMEKTANKEVEELADEVFQRALEKVAEAKPKAEKGPKEMLEEAEDEEELEEIEEAIEEEEKKKEAAIEKLSSFEFDSDSKKELFEKIASYQLANAPRIVRDNNFQHYETLDGIPKAIQQLFDAPGEEVNNIY